MDKVRDEFLCFRREFVELAERLLDGRQEAKNFGVKWCQLRHRHVARVKNIRGHTLTNEQQKYLTFLIDVFEAQEAFDLGRIDESRLRKEVGSALNTYYEHFERRPD